MLIPVSLFSVVLFLVFQQDVVVGQKEVKNWLTTCDSDDGHVLSLLSPQSSISTTSYSSSIKSSGTAKEIQINKETLLQSMEGFGAGLPQSSAYVLIKLKHSNLNLYQSTLQQLVGKNNENGIEMNMIRFPIGSC